MWKQVVARVRKASPASEVSSPAATLVRPVQIDPPSSPPSPAPSPKHPAPSLIFPDELLDAAEDGRRTGTMGAGRVVRAGGLVVLGALAGVGAWALFTTPFASRAPLPAETAPARAEPALVADAAVLAGAVTQAVSSFDLRARMFDSHQMQCADLARGLVLLEERWTSYSAGHAGVSLDSTRGTSDQSLYASVDQAERRFERSGCPRP